MLKKTLIALTLSAVFGAGAHAQNSTPQAAGAGGSDRNANQTSGQLGNQGNDRPVGNAGGQRGNRGGGNGSTDGSG